MKTKIKTVRGEDIWLEEKQEPNVFIFSVMLLSFISACAFLVMSFMRFSDLCIIGALISFIIALITAPLILVGIASEPAYSVFTRNRVSKTISILNDGTDQVRVCIAAKEIERQIIEDYNRVKNLEKIAEGCK